MNLPFFRRKDAETLPGPAVSLEREGQEWLNRLTGAMRTEPWLVTLLKLAWTAGPATLVAAWAGYYLGFGKSAPMENLRFFFAYTVIFGVIGLLAGIFARATYGKKREKAEKDLLLVADYLPDLIAATRDQHLASLDSEVRRIEAVGLLLQRVDLDTEALTLALEELGASEQLAKLIAKIDIYRIAGLDSRVDELIAEASEQAKPMVDIINDWAPHVAKLLLERINGHAPSFNDGVTRDSNFLERVLAAMERDDDQLMTLLDAEEVLVLACELINGRRIPMLVFSFRGQDALAEATEQLERRRNLYRIANATVVSRLKALVALLGDSDELETDSATRGLESDILWDRARNGLNGLNGAVSDLGERLPTATTDERLRLRLMIHTLKSALELTDDMERSLRRAARRHSLFLRTAEKWAKQVEKTEGAELGLGSARQRGFQVVERHLQLTGEQSIALAVEFAGILRDWGILSRADKLLYRRGTRQLPLNTEVIKALAKEVAAALQPFVDITQPEIQRAIDSSPAANLLGLERGLSARVKAAWGAAAAHEVDENLAQAAERLAGVLVTNYRVKLNEAAMEFLHRQYGARLERLKTLNSSSESVKAPRSTLLAQKPLAMPLDANWRQTLDQSRGLIKRYGHVLK